MLINGFLNNPKVMFFYYPVNRELRQATLGLVCEELKRNSKVKLFIGLGRRKETTIFRYKTNQRVYIQLTPSVMKKADVSGEFSKVMQTRDIIEGLHNCLEFS